jgi:F-type H+-transporting ATPase subunit b
MINHSKKNQSMVSGPAPRPRAIIPPAAALIVTQFAAPFMVAFLPLAATLFAALFSALLAAPPAYAAGEAPPGPMDLVWQGVNLTVLLAIIIYFTRKPIAAFFRGAASREKEGYDSALRESEEMAAELEAQKQKIAGLESELERMVQAARADAAEEGRLMAENAEAQAERIRAQARNQLEQEMSKATSALRAQLADEAVKLAGELIRSRLDDDRQQQLIAGYIEQLGAQR